MKKTNMRFIFCPAFFIATALLAGGCASTKIFDPETEKHEIRQDRSVSSEEMREAAIAGVNDALEDAKIKNFLQKYKVEKSDANAIPVMKVDILVNNTDDPDLNVLEMTDYIGDRFMKTGIVDVTIAEGADKTNAFVQSRDLVQNANFDQSTVVKRGTLQAARLLLRPKVSSTMVKNDSKQATVRTFTMELADVQTGLVLWKYSKQLGYQKKKGWFGW